jgi:hypothetical protein
LPGCTTSGDCAATDTIRRITYFSAQGITGHLLVISAWLAAGTALTLLTSLTRSRRTTTA